VREILERGVILSCILVLFVTLASSMSLLMPSATSSGFMNRNDVQLKEIPLEKFSSQDELKDFIETSSEIASFDVSYFPAPVIEYSYWDYVCCDSAPVLQVGTMKIALGGYTEQPYGFTINNDSSLPDFSATNIQVTGVDEADIVKTDGKFIYVMSGNEVIIIDAYPAEEARVLSRIEVDGRSIEIFINGDKLVVVGDTWYPQKAFVRIYDVSDKNNPMLFESTSVDGSYFDSRMIGDYVYLVVNASLDYQDNEIDFPEISSDGEVRAVQASEVYHFGTFESSYMFTIITSINLNNGEQSSKVLLTGATQNIFVSQNNIYVTYTEGQDMIHYWDNLLCDAVRILPGNVCSEINEVDNSRINFGEEVCKTKEIMLRYYENLDNDGKRSFRSEFERAVSDVRTRTSQETTVIRRISITNGEIRYTGMGEVPGSVLNQFSMDEYDGYFRIATTTGEVWNGNAQNHVYVLNENLSIVGRLDGLAPNERIFSVRFMGNRAYLVTFKRFDPLFVIDLANPANPRVLGELEIPGYSDYLHPYDETHIIGVGKDTVDVEWENAALYQGVKIALFDVSDPENPREMSKYVIGARGTDSEALSDHRAFLFSREKNLLVIPVSLVESSSNYWSWHGGYDWQGAYVFNVSLDDGIVFRGGIDHSDSSVSRSLYIDDVLYTISDGLVKMNSLADLSEVGEVNLAQ